MKRTMIFVGHARSRDANINPGGFATSSRLLLESDFFDRWNTIVVDISSKAFPREGLFRLITRGIRRLAAFTKACLKSDSGIAVIFSAHRTSFIEKMIMCLVGTLLGVRCSLFIRSGYFMDDVRSSKVPRVYRWLLSIPQLLLCPSPAWVQFYNTIGIPPDRCVVVPNWIDVDSFTVCRKEQPPSDAVTFIFVGWLVGPKGVYEFVEAAGKIRNELPCARWIVVGGGPEQDALRRRASELGLSDRILFTGWARPEEVLEYLKLADVLVLPTHTDAFPNVILEGMAAGLPVITTAVGGIPGLIRNGENGILVPPGDSLILASAMSSLARNYELRKALSTAGIHYVSHVHDSRLVLSRLGAVLSSL